MIGDNLRAERARKNISRNELASQIDVHFNTIRKWENNENEPTVSKALKICKILGCNLEDLYK